MLLRLEIPEQEVVGDFAERRTIIAPISYYNAWSNVVEYYIASPKLPLGYANPEDGTIEVCYRPSTRSLLLSWVEDGVARDATVRGVLGMVVEGFPAIEP